MSATIETVVHCDGCGICFCEGDAREQRAPYQRKDAELEGWIMRRGYLDYCPRCKDMPLKNDGKTAKEKGLI